MMSKMIGKILCLVGLHDYTTKHAQGEEPDLDAIKGDPVGYFFEWSRMFCSRCNKTWRD